MMSQLEMSQLAVERQTRSAIDLVIQIERFADGKRQVTHISEVRKGKDLPRPPAADLFLITEGPSKAQRILRSTSATPSFLGRLSKSGMEIPSNLFMKKSEGSP